MESPHRWPAIRAKVEALKGPAVTLLLLAVVWVLPGDLYQRFYDACTSLLVLSIVYSALSGGFGPALASTLLTLGYFAMPAILYGFSPEYLVRIGTLAIAFPFGCWLLLYGKSRAELTVKLRAERDTALAYARQLESEVERRLAELQQANSQQDELERFRELDRLKGMFVNAVSHELRTPLTTIVGYIEFMEDGIGGTLSPMQTDYVQQIHRSSKQLERLVDDLLDFARLEAGTFKLNLKEADLTDKVHQVANSLRPQVLEARLLLEVEAPQAPLLAKIDSQRIDQVLLNFLSNAIKFTPEGGTLRIRLGLEGAMARFEVTDTGIGICPSQHDKLFRPYSQIENERGAKGTGLGLSISKAIIEAHGGDIGVESMPGMGSTFWLRLPLHLVNQADRGNPAGALTAPCLDRRPTARL